MQKTKYESVISVAKDLVVLIRDLAIIVFAVLLLLFPIKFNTILVEAGFEEGSIVGFKWKSKLVETNEALEQANVSIAELKAENQELVAAFNEAKQAISDSSLRETLSALGKTNTELERKTNEVQSIVRDTIEANEPLVAKAAQDIENTSVRPSDYTVGLQTVGIDDQERKRLNKEISDYGYSLDSVTYSYDSGNKPSWFAFEPTVFYYSSKSKMQAESLAALMTEKTGVSFKVSRGAGLGVNPSKKHLTFFVHYL